MKWKPYQEEIAICIVCSIIGLSLGDIASYLAGILSLLGIILGVALMLPRWCLYGYSRKRAWLRKQAAQEGA